MVLAIWYVLFVALIIPIDKNIAKAGTRLPPLLTLVWLGCALFVPIFETPQDAAMIQQAFDWWRGLDHVGTWTVGLIVAAPIFWGWIR